MEGSFMTGDRGAKPAVGKFDGFSFVEFVVGNALQAADWYCTRFGFKRVAYRGLETGSRRVASHVVQQGKIQFVFTSPLEVNDPVYGSFLAQHGDAVYRVGFNVDDVKALHAKAVERGAKEVDAPEELSDDNGTVVISAVRTYGDVVHAFVQRGEYKGVFLPGYKNIDDEDPVIQLTAEPGLHTMDHCVGNQPDKEMVPAVEWYEKCLDFHRFWSVDDKIITTEYSSLRSIVVTDFDETIKMPINEPANGKRKSQIQEYVDYYGGAGVQHIALRTDNIIETIKKLRARGLKFLNVPKSYYTLLRERLAKSPTKVKEDLDVLEELAILVDFDDNGYLLQIFTKPLQDRPTFFIEVIQRENHSGFGAGNFKSLFEAIEREQELRGNL